MLCSHVFFPSKEGFIFVSSDCSLVKLTSFCLNPNLVLHLCAAVFLKSIIILVISSFSITILSDCFLIHLLVHIYVFCGLKDISLGSHSIFYDLILHLHVFHGSIVFHFYLLFLRHFFRAFLYIYQPYWNSIFHRSFRNFDFFFWFAIFSQNYSLKQIFHD